MILIKMKYLKKWQVKQLKAAGFILEFVGGTFMGGSTENLYHIFVK